MHIPGPRRPGAEDYTPDLTKLKCHWKIALKIHWTFPENIHWERDNPLEHTTDK